MLYWQNAYNGIIVREFWKTGRNEKIMKKKRMKLFAIALVISMIVGTWSVGGVDVVARETTTSETDEEIQDTETAEAKAQEVDNTEATSQNLEDNQEQFTGFAGGDGSEENPYQISTSEMFREMAEYQGQYFVLISDLDLSDSPRINFEGIFDGNGYTIETGFSEENGMFNKLGETSVVKNCTINIGNESYSFLPAEHFGAVALQNNGLIKKCIVSGSVINTTAEMIPGDIAIGSVCSANYGKIEKCRSDVDYSIRVNIGSRFMLSGICNAGKVDQCLNTGNINAQVQRNIPNSGYFDNCLAGVECLSETNECANTGNISLDFSSLLTSSAGIYNYSGFISAYEFTSYSYILPSKMEGIKSCYISDDVQFSFSTYNLGSGGGVNSKSTVLYADDVTGTQVKTEDEILEWWDSVFNDDGETWIPDGAFSISKTGDWVSGKECALAGSYSASTPGNAEAEAKKIVWSSSDNSILDVTDPIIDFYIADEENNHVSIQKSFTAKKAGTVTITATSPDGRSASMTVDVIDSDDTGDISTSILDYEKYQAKYYSENVSLITGGYMTYSAIEDNYTPTKYALANILSFGWTAKFGFTDSSEIWETLLLDILLQRTANISASGELENEILQLCNTLYDEAIKNDISDLKDNIDANVNNVNTLVSKYESLKGISTSKSVIGKLIEAAETVEDFINYYAKYVELRSYIADDTKVFLNKMQSTTVYNDIPAFQRALDNVIQHLSVDENELAQLVIMETATDKLFTKAMNISVENIVNILIPGVSTVVDFTKDVTICMMNAILDTNELSQLNVYLYMLDSIDEAAKEAMEKSASEYLNSDGNNYRAVNGGLQFITDISSYGVSICRQWGSIVSTDILTKVSNKFLIASRPHYDVANDYFNLNHPSTINEKNQYIEELCLTDEKYIDSVLRSMPGMARMAWYKDSGASEDKISCLVLFYVLNPETGSKTVTATVVPTNFRVSFPELGVKNGYITPTQWYLDEECTQVADSNQLITENTIFYTKWTRSIFYMLTESGGASIVSIDAQAEQQIPFAINTLSKSIKNDPKNGIYEIPAYIDGYRVETLGDDIFAGVSNVSYVSLPGTLLDISDSAFASVEENATFVYVEGSVAEKYILEKNYSNTESIKELYFKNTPGQMIIGETVQLELVQEGSCISDDVQWKSSEENVVSVEEGKLIAKAEGNSIISAQVGGVIASFEITVTKEEPETPGEHTHSYDRPEFNWSEDNQTCTAVFICESCNDKRKIECDITSETTDPTCTEDGKTVYTATVFFADKEYTDTQEEGITATGHTYEYTDNRDGTHTKVCTAGDDTATEAHTYQESICTFCGAEESEGHTHKYGEPKFTWSNDYSKCTATFTCADGDDQQIVECAVTPKDNGDGTVSYTAVAEFNGESYTAEQVVDNQDELDEKLESGKPTESGDDNNLGNSTDVNEGSAENKTSEESASNVQTGDDSILVLWSLLIVLISSVGIMVLLIRRKYKK